MPGPDPRYSRYVLLAVAMIGYSFLCYAIERHDGFLLLGTYAVLFLVSWGLWHQYAKEVDSRFSSEVNLVAIGLRLVPLFALPNLSDDFYRFIWDGHLLNAGINPFAELPSHYIADSWAIPGLSTELFERLNSPEYFTIYPPVNQLIFWMATALFPNGVYLPALVMKLFILAAEVGNIWLLPRVLETFGKDKKYALLYTLNPLVIIEGVGNIHFEPMMFFFLLLALWWMQKERLTWSAIAMALAVGTKLIPLIFLPFLPRPFTLKRMIHYYLVAGLSIVLLFLPLLSSELIEGLQSSLALYYQKFEFNASIYFILREQGFQEFGYNRIEFIGKDLVKYTFWSILILAYWPLGRRPALPTQLLFALGIHFLLSTTVHPWYIITLVGLSVFTGYRSPVLWGFLVFFTYLGYTTEGYQLPTWVLFLEYGAVLSWFIYEMLTKNEWKWRPIRIKQ